MKLDKDRITIGIIHSLFKLTPEFDEVAAGSGDDGKIDLIMFETYPSLMKKIRARWSKRSQKLIDNIDLYPGLIIMSSSIFQPTRYCP